MSIRGQPSWKGSHPCPERQRRRRVSLPLARVTVTSMRGPIRSKAATSPSRDERHAQQPAQNSIRQTVQQLHNPHDEPRRGFFRRGKKQSELSNGVGILQQQNLTPEVWSRDHAGLICPGLAQASSCAILRLPSQAGMAELADAADSKSAEGNFMGVRFPLPAPRINKRNRAT